MIPSEPGQNVSDVAIYEAKNRLSELINRVEAGEEIAITRRGKVVARLVPAVAQDMTALALDAIATLRACRQGVGLGGLNSRDLVREGRR